MPPYDDVIACPQDVQPEQEDERFRRELEMRAEQSGEACEYHARELRRYEAIRRGAIAGLEALDADKLLKVTQPIPDQTIYSAPGRGGGTYQ